MLRFCSTTAAKALMSKESAEKGQALIEFVLISPLLIVFLWYLVQVSMTINASEVQQKNLRTYFFTKLHNHRDPPVEHEVNAVLPNRAAYVMGVSADIVQSEGEDAKRAVAPIFALGLGPNPKEIPGASDDPGEPEEGALRQRVRIRTAIGICTARKTKAGTNERTTFCGD